MVRFARFIEREIEKKNVENKDAEKENESSEKVAMQVFQEQKKKTTEPEKKTPLARGLKSFLGTSTVSFETSMYNETIIEFGFVREIQNNQGFVSVITYLALDN